MKRIIIVLLITLFSVVIVSADGVDDQGNPNDPDVNDRANACYDDGAMESKCDTLWEWVCGWHVIRLDSQNEASRAAFPQGCVSLLPAYIEYVAPVAALGTPSANCVQYGGGPFSTNFAGGYFQAPGDTWYLSTNCTGTSGPFGAGVYLVYAPAPFDALTLCNLNSAFSSVTGSPAYINDVYQCMP